MELIFRIFSIVLIDLVLAGDNAVVIGMASRKLPPKQRMNAILWGTGGAVGLRILFTAIATILLQIPLLHAIGGLLLVWIAWKLLTEESKHDVAESDTLWGAIRTIILADAVMSLDNVLAVAGAAHGEIELVIFGLLLSIPIVVWGSQFVARLMERFPVIVYLGAGILAWTAGGMLIGDEVVRNLLGHAQAIELGVPIAVVALILGLGYLRNRPREPENTTDA